MPTRRTTCGSSRTRARSSRPARRRSAAGSTSVTGIRGRSTAPEARLPRPPRTGRSTSARPEDGQVYVRAMAEELVCRFGQRASHTPAMTTDAEMWVTPQVWEEVRSLVEQASTLLHAEAKPPRTDGTLHVNLTAAAFQLDPSPIAPESRRVAPEVTAR